MFNVLIGLLKGIRPSHLVWLFKFLKWAWPRSVKKAKRPAHPAPPDYFTHGDVRIIKFLADDYKWAARLVGIPWRLLPVMHKIERGLRTSPCTGGWPQLDMGASSPEAGRTKRETYVGRIMRQCGVKEYGPLRSDVRTGAMVCAWILLRKVPNRLKGKPWTEEKVAEASFGYNGRARYYNQFWQTGSGSKVRSWRWSPYVANWLDGRKLFVKGRQYHKGKRVAIPRREYKNPGTILLYRELRRRKAELG